MSIVHDQSTNGATAESQVIPTIREQKYHRIAAVRREQGVSLRSVSRQMGKTMSTVRVQEEETSDLLISDLLRWQQVLGVPLQDLLVDTGPHLSQPVMERARLVRLMKTAAAIRENVKSVGTQRMATMLIQQLIDIMPELEEVSPWHSVGQRRSLEEYGRVVERCVSDDLFIHRE